MEGLFELGKRYTRKEVHNTFFPNNTNIDVIWGQQGMIQIKKEENNWIFYINLGHKQGDHQFIESISPTGILSWQTQPSLTFEHKQVKNLLDFDINTNKILLFFRLKKHTSKDKSYMYLGELDYFDHDSVLQKPVYISWKLLDWDNIKNDKFIQEIFEEQTQIQKQLQCQSEKPQKKHEEPPKGDLKKVSEPAHSNNNKKKKKRVGTLNLDPIKLKEIGDEGEKLVLKYEIEQLKNSDFANLAEKVVHSSVVEGDGLGYDILSYSTEDGSHKYIEVKTTNQSLDAPYFISENERKFAEEMGDKFCLYRVYLPDEKDDTNTNKGSRKTFSFFVVDGESLLKDWEFTPSNYKVYRK